MPMHCLRISQVDLQSREATYQKVAYTGGNISITGCTVVREVGTFFDCESYGPVVS